MLIDLVGVRAGAHGVPFARRAKELARLNASFLCETLVTRGERLRFLRAYLASVGQSSRTGKAGGRRYRRRPRRRWRRTAAPAACSGILPTDTGREL